MSDYRDKLDKFLYEEAVKEAKFYYRMDCDGDINRYGKSWDYYLPRAQSSIGLQFAVGQLKFNG